MAFDFDSDVAAGLDLGPSREPVRWVAFAPPLVERDRGKRSNGHASAKPAPAPAKPQPAAAAANTQQPPPAGQGKADGASAGLSAKARRRARRPRYAEPPPELASGVHGRVRGAVMLEPESDEGNVEYKLRLKQPNPVRFQQLVTQMRFRLSEGGGECFYYLGVEDDGYPRGLSQAELDTSLQTLQGMAGAAQAGVQQLRLLPGCKGRQYLIVRVRRLCAAELAHADLSIAVAGCVDAGKSTLVAVLTQGQKGRPLLDSGAGSARMAVLRHKHEIETGRTSSLSQHLLAYDCGGRVLNYAGVQPLLPAEVAAAASKVLRFVDLGGHQRYLKTALYGLTSLLPHRSLLCVCPLAGLGRVAREHCAASLALRVPLAVVLTKADVAPAAAVEAVLADLQQLLLAAAAASAGRPEQRSGGLLYEVVEREQQATALAAAQTGSKLPVFLLACTTGAGLPLLHCFLSSLQPDPCSLQPGPSLQPDLAAAGIAAAAAAGAGSFEVGAAASSAAGLQTDSAAAPAGAGSRENEAPSSSAAAMPAHCQAHFQVDQTFDVKGVGSVVGGTVVAGEVSVGQRLLLGPDECGAFTRVAVTSIQRSQVPVQRIRAGQHATLAFRPEALAAQPPLADAAPAPAAAEPPCSPDLAACSSAGPDGAAACGESGAAAGGSQQLQADRRHDTWREQGSAFAAAAAAESGRRSSSSGSSRGDSPRVALGGGADRRLSAEQALALPQLEESAPSLEGLSLQAGCSPVQQPLPAPAKAGSGAAVAEAAPGAVADVLLGRRREGAAAGSSDDDAPHAAGGGSPCARSPGPSARKGTVLLDCAAQPAAAWEFEAAMVVFAGFWPARGLLSGAWPPRGESDAEESDCSLLADSPAASFERGRSPLARLARKQHREAYAPVVHCGSVRQAARVVVMSELQLQRWDAGEASAAAGCDLGPAMAAAGALRTQAQGEACVALVRLRFLQQPEWLQAGARLVVRDRTESSIAGAGVVRCIFA